MIPSLPPPSNSRSGYMRSLSGSASTVPSVQWSRSLVQEIPRTSRASPHNPSPRTRAFPVIKSERLPLEINTSIEHIPDASSASSLSLSSLGESEEAVTSGTDDGSGSRESMDVEFKSESVPPTPIEDIKSISGSSESPVGKYSRALAPARRGRGRPRKNPTTPTSPKIKENKGRSSRSKTGCLTCRKRKKKCDERKPECRNCEKNNVTCEGYPAKTEWQSGKLTGKQRSNEMSRRLSLPPLPNQVSSTVIPGLDTELDRVFFAHFNNKLSMVLTVRDDDESNPFQQLIIPMACNYKGLMHSLLALSGSHLVRVNPGNHEYQKRKEWHYTQAISDLAKEVALARERNKEVEDPIVASMILQCLIPISEGSTNGEYRVHLDGARRYIKPRADTKFGAFAWEFYKYHDMSSAVTSLHRPPTYFDDLVDDRSLPSFAVPHTIHPGDGVMVGVLDGLFKFISRITLLRDHVRARKAQGLEPCCDYPVFDQAAEIDSYLLNWQTGQEKDTARDIAAELYREAVLVYLRRSIRASRPDPEISERVDRGIIYLQTLPSNNSTQCILLLPLFILGCAAFEKHQRDKINIAFDHLQDYSRLGNITPARQVVGTVWEMMDAGDERSWDWETIMLDMKYDFLVT